jgi:hypothetical protein
MKTNTHHKKLGCLALATALSICPATAIDIPLADDAGVFQSASGATVNTNGLNYGRRTDFIVSSTSNAARWGYLRFDVGSFLPAGTKADEVGKAVLRLWPSAVTTPGRIAVHKVVSSSWSEGTKNGVAPGAENSITFNTRPEAAVTESTFPVSPTWLGCDRSVM